MPLRSRNALVGHDWPGTVHRPLRASFSISALGFGRLAPGALSVELSIGPVDLAIFAIAVLVAIRIALTATLPLCFDEAYYWLWSKHLALGYFDHPAAIALAIRAGTLLFGDTEFGVRFVPLVASAVASWAIWRSATIILKDRWAGAIACLLFNCTLMMATVGMAATPDALLIPAAALLLWAIAELERTQDGRWWLAAGAAGGLAISAKYTGIFLFGSVAVWLLADAIARRDRAGVPWLSTIWPYAGAAIAFTIFAPTLYWNATHAFISFRFQLGRIAVDHPGARYFVEFVGGQIALLSPGILALAGIGFYQALRSPQKERLLSLVVTMVWLPLLYFAFHSLHDRVQGNWPCFVCPALAVLAAKAFTDIHDNRSPSRTMRLVRASALPIAAVILLAAYVQAFFGIIPLGRNDPIARITGVGVRQVTDKVFADARELGANAIVTTNYTVTGWLRFYQRSGIPVIQITDDDRFLSSPRPGGSALNGRPLYVTQHPGLELQAVRAQFSSVQLFESVTRARNGHPIDTFDVFQIGGFRGKPVGRVP